MALPSRDACFLWGDRRKLLDRGEKVLQGRRATGLLGDGSAGQEGEVGCPPSSGGI